MTVKEHLDKLEAVGGAQLAGAMAAATDIWSNNAARGYFIQAAQFAGLDQDTTRRVLEGMTAAFDALTVDEAEQKFIAY